MKKEFKSVWVRLFIVCLVAAVGVSFSGCETLKKKFTRQKKKKDAAENAEFVPVLEPEEYPEKIYSAEKDYQYRYSMWQVWSKELETAITDGETDKRQIYLLNQSIDQLQGMTKILNEQARPGLQKLLGRLEKVKGQLQSPAPMRDNFQILNEIRRTSKEIKENYKYEKVQSALIPQEPAS